MMNNRAEIGIICAMQVEIDGYLSQMTEKNEITVSGIRFYYGILAKKTVVLALCGIGKVFAAMCAQTMILKFSPKCIINTGVAGSLSEKIGIGGTVIASEVLQHDMDTSAIGDPVGMISGINVIELPTSERLTEIMARASEELGFSYILGKVASGDQFISTKEKKAWIKDTFGASACEMEGAAIGQVCYVNNVEFCVLRAISDGGDENASLDYPKFVREASARAVAIMSRAISFI